MCLSVCVCVSVCLSETRFIRQGRNYDVYVCMDECLGVCVCGVCVEVSVCVSVCLSETSFI